MSDALDTRRSTLGARTARTWVGVGHVEIMSDTTRSALGARDDVARTRDGVGRREEDVGRARRSAGRSLATGGMITGTRPISQVGSWGPTPFLRLRHVFLVSKMFVSVLRVGDMFLIGRNMFDVVIHVLSS